MELPEKEERFFVSSLSNSYERIEGKERDLRLTKRKRKRAKKENFYALGEIMRGNDAEPLGRQSSNVNICECRSLNKQTVSAGSQNILTIVIIIQMKRREGKKSWDKKSLLKKEVKGKEGLA